MRKTTLKIISVLALLASCSDSQNGQGTIATDTSSVRNNPDNSHTPTYFDYKNTRREADFTDTVFAKFSSDTTEDQFTLTVPKGLLVETKTTIRILNNLGEIVYEHIFPTSDLVNGYATEEIKTDAEMDAYISSEIRSFLKDGLLNPNRLPEDSYLKQVTPEDFENYDVYLSNKRKNRILFHYCLNEETHFFLGYSDKERKVVKIIDCC